MSHPILTFVLSAGAGALMVRLGVQSKLLEWRHGLRCPACGRLRRSGVCPHCTR
ncbi:MAG TPA: hypothetical protein VN449_05120 [Gaiellaceae bacterium]|nr:hypothetical protein [Gaiellaceae bacterium]